MFKTDGFKSVFNLFFSLLFFLSLGLGGLAHADDPDLPDDIRDLPRLSADLPPGTLAWATADQLHPTQPQVGASESEIKENKMVYKDRSNKRKFSNDLYEYLYKQAAPVIIGPDQPSSGNRKSLGYIVDRTHASLARASQILVRYGAKGLSRPKYSKGDKPLNYFLVVVKENHEDMPYRDFADYMVENEFTYLWLWTRDPDSPSQTKIERIEFSDLPRHLIDLTNNPFRGFVSDLQRRGEVISFDEYYSQFNLAKELRDANVVTWDQISESATRRVYEEAIDRATAFFKSPQGKLAIRRARGRNTCVSLFK